MCTEYDDIFLLDKSVNVPVRFLVFFLVVIIRNSAMSMSWLICFLGVDRVVHVTDDLVVTVDDEVLTLDHHHLVVSLLASLMQENRMVILILDHRREEREKPSRRDEERRRRHSSPEEDRSPKRDNGYFTPSFIRFPQTNHFSF